MSSFHSDKCSPEELKVFKKQVLKWLDSIGIKKPRCRALRCYGGDIRIYTGEKFEIQNRKSTFRRTEPRKDEQGNIIGWNGLRGQHITTIVDYIPINRDEFNNLKKEWNNPDTWNCDIDRLKKLCQN